MKKLLVAALLLAASPVAAQPGIRANCEVTIVRAPDDVRAMVESWVEAEPNCNAKLEVRIVPTQGGYYLLARDEFGRTRERVVPDAQSAGVLVASWVATDTHEGQTPFDIRQPPPPAQPAVAPAAPPVIGGEAFAPPGESAAVVAPATAKAALEDQPRWVSLGALIAMSGTGGGGVRGEFDWKASRRATFGLLGSVSTSGVYTESSSVMGPLELLDAKLHAFVSLGVQWGKWRLRPQFAGGLVYTQARIDGPYSSELAEGVFFAGEVSTTLSRDIGSAWSIAAGPVVSIYLQEFNIEDSPYYSYVSRELEAMFLIAGRYRL